MDDGGRLVPRDSAVYQEFARLYRLAQNLRPTGIDHWSGDLYATPGGSWGGYSPVTGDIRVSGPVVLRHLVDPASTPAERAEAFATVLHEATHAGMDLDAPNEPNAVRTVHSQGAAEGFAELRTANDFETFTASAGHPELILGEPQYPGAFAAMESLAQQASGLAKDQDSFIEEGVHGPAVMHFDQLADGVVRNRLAEVVPFHEDHRRAVRAALIATMVHPGWPVLKDSSRRTGEKVGEEIRQKLNSKVDEIRGHYRSGRGEVFPVEAPNAEVGRERGAGRADGVAESGKRGAGGGHPEMRFLSGQAAAAGAV
ncbi:hypothetical protein, partial [Kribbella koreensis]